MAQVESSISYGRQADLVDQDRVRALHVNILGLGTVGSHAAVELARFGVGSLTLIDPDVVEAHNLPSQAYAVTDLGRLKNEACAERVRAVSDHVRIDARPLRLAGGESLPPGPVILAVDDMDARRAITEGSLAWRGTHSLVIDGRMAGRLLQLYCFDPNDQDALDGWLKSWFPQDEASPVPCGGRSVSYIGAFVGSMIASLVHRQLDGQPLPPFTQIDLEHLTVFATRTPVAA